MNEFGAAVPIRDQAHRLDLLRQEFGRSKERETSVARIVRWVLANPWTRTVSPLSDLTVPDYVKRCIYEGRAEEAAQAYPGHPLLASSSRKSAGLEEIDQRR